MYLSNIESDNNGERDTKKNANYASNRKCVCKNKFKCLNDMN